MAGFDNGTLQGGIAAQAKQFGSIIRGFGPPVPQAGVAGDVYIDVQTWFLYENRAGGTLDPWGHYLFQVPLAYRTALKFFTTTMPTDDIGVPGDYCLLWGGFANYGLQPSIFGPKQATSWPENGNGPTLTINPASAATVLPIGLVDEGAPIAYSNSTQLIMVGLVSEIIFPLPVTAAGNDPVLQNGLQSGPAQVPVVVNPLFTAEDSHAV